MNHKLRLPSVGKIMKKLNKLTLSISFILLITGCNSSVSKISTTGQNIEKTTIIDGLTYENKPFIKEYNWDDANRYCKDKGWRLPTRAELAKVSNIPLCKIDSDCEKWFAKNKSKKNSNLFVKKIFVENMSKTDIFWTVEEDTSMPKEYNYHYTILFYEGNIGTNEGHLSNGVLCVK